jgi:hypothetical protein
LTEICQFTLQFDDRFLEIELMFHMLNLYPILAFQATRNLPLRRGCLNPSC